MTWAADIISLPDDVAVGSLTGFLFLGFHLLCPEESSRSFGVVCVGADVSRVRAAVFSSATRDWVVHPWVEIGGEYGLNYGAGALVNGSVYCPFYEDSRVIRINTATMDVSSLDLPSLPSWIIDYGQVDFIVGDTKDGELCMLYASDDFHLHVWIRGVDGDGIGVSVPLLIPSLSAQIERTTGESEGKLRVVQARSGCVYLCMICITPADTQHSWLFYHSLGTKEIELMINGTFDYCAYPYIMAWPPCLICDDEGTAHEVEGSH
ncbi:hypothetical protein CFC21_014729 [Triticum aestivum]|uniref:F-box associated domain-containing protein n=2 Tax=Triticum aestivum TaxID=4565 RepID=A0A3B6AQL0_WHEAT|nr:uncharacterized protein LOC123187082 [Triticum aestivum]XP_044454785.1 uncharacterized protein LOC123187082 [Triticum aestivum]KAF6998626.1 hypothetical protein CFC21_014729 [Triticum aestivum]